ncbi:Arginine decarboxylase 1-like protein [Gossypium australe]|uniref:Arginine decarboxylase 1-like protein n=1 Tax=Gossypium australe TaxID=47621 RepID=A0A5B6U9Q7_9ROSI|nr:Arginine decarboxylase 1-like protein [Gossypium australe]
MSSQMNILHEFQFPEASRTRKKVDIDGFMLMEASKDEACRKEEEKKTDGLESKYDLRKSLAWDSAFFTSPGVLDPEELFETLNINDGDNGLKEPSALPSESMAASRIGECVARRSLAWDAAFFTSAGVLDPEELSLVNNGYKRSETVTHILPGTELEFWKSTESNSTMESEYSLSSLEIDLFDDMRASMHKSCKASDLLKSSSKFQSQTGIPNPHCKYLLLSTILHVELNGGQSFSTSKRVDTTSMRVKTLPASRRPKTTADGVRKTLKEVTNPTKAQHGTRSGELDSSSSLRLSKASNQANPFSPGATKRASLGANQMKINNKVRKAVPGQNMSKKPCIGDRGTPPPESTSRVHIVSKDLSGSVCGHNVSTLKSPSSLRRKNDLIALDSDVRTPKFLTGHKSKQIDSSQPTGFQSTPKSTSTSLCNSMDCWSSETSASLNHVNNDASQGLDTQNCSNDQLVPSGSKETRLPDQDVGRFSKGSCHPPSTVSRETKPSGLRLPSPKIGFFEVGNSGEFTPNGVRFHSGLQKNCKTRTSVNHINGTPNRSRSEKLQSPRTLSRTSNLKEKKLGSLQNGTRSSMDIKLNCAAKLEVEKASPGTLESSPAATSMAETELSCESSNGHRLKIYGFGSYVKGDYKGRIQPESKEHATQLVEKSSQDQKEEIIAPKRDENENLLGFKSQVDVLTMQIEAIDVNGGIR